ncbi:MAG: hypothetical protein ACE147_05065 [Candidatus Methylomirabilales bacterium]
MRRKLIGALILGTLFLSSGCGALVLLGVGGTAGYMIKKGEDSGGGKGPAKSSDAKPADAKTGGASKAAAAPKASSTQKTSTSD